TVDVILQRMTRAMLAGGAHGGEAVRGRRAQPADEEGREEKREGVEDERHVEAEPGGDGAAEETAHSDRSPGGGLGERVGGVQLLAGGDQRQDGGAAAGEKG